MSTSDTPAQGVRQRAAQITRRKEARYQCAPATAGRLSIYKDNKPQHAWILNLSASGIGLLLDSAVEPGTYLVVHLTSTSTGAQFDLLTRVAHCTPQNAGEWLVGCELAEKLGQADLDALL